MVDYTRIVGTVFCGSVSLSQGLFSLDKFLSYFAYKRLEQESNLMNVLELSDVLYDATLGTIETVTYNPDLYHGIFMGISSVAFAGITYYFSKNIDEKK